MWESVVTMTGTLAGVVTAGWMQQRSAHAARVAQWADDRRGERLAAVTALLVALADHRGAMFRREEIRLTKGENAAAYGPARVASHETRAAVTAPHASLAILVPEVAEAGQRAVSAAYALRDASSLGELETLRRASVEACNDLLAAASAVV